MSSATTNTTEGGSCDRDIHADAFKDNPSYKGSTGGKSRASTNRSISFENGENKTALSTAIVVINFQNEFVDWAGQLHNDVGDLIQKTGMLNKVPNVIRAAR